MPAATAQSPKVRPASVGFNLLAIAIAVALTGTGLAYVVDQVARGDRDLPLPEGTITRGIGGIELKIPAAFFRNDEDRSEGFAEEIELIARLPLGTDAREIPVEVTLLPRSRARPSAILLDAVYLHQFEGAQLSGPPGLVGKPLVATEGFAGETVWYDPLNADPFVAKCLAPVVPDEPAQCLRTVIRGNVAVVYTFGEDVLMNWRQFDAAAEPWLAEMGVR
jgi:hypothetical protein